MTFGSIPTRTRQFVAYMAFEERKGMEVGRKLAWTGFNSKRLWEGPGAARCGWVLLSTFRPRTQLITLHLRVPEKINETIGLGHDQDVCATEA